MNRVDIGTFRVSMKKISSKELSKIVWRHPACLIAFGFGSGLMPFVPGTWGTLAAIPIYLLLASTNPVVYLVFVLIAFLLGIFVCNKTSSILGVHDYGGIVWDEIVGFLLTMFLAPSGVMWIVIGFILFRLFDIWKPYPIDVVDEQVQGGLGIMLDDILAAVLSWIVLQGLAWWWQ